MKHIDYAFILLAFLMGCAQVGLTPAKSFDEKLAYAYGTHTAVLQTAAQAVNSKSMSSADGAQVLKLADESRTLLDAARIASKAGNVDTANGKLILATSILVQLQQYLQARAK
jgi:hypothetical protein